SLLPCALIFYPYVYLRDLHSFPTRRSSDLVRVPVRERGVRPGRPGRRADLGGAAAGGHLGDGVEDDGQAADGRGRGAGAADARPDRKSTRLNSSHVKISYAVFCLKKKKEFI